MTIPSILFGAKYGKLTAIARIESSSTGHARWVCWCECGGEVVVLATNLKRGLTASCGCLNLARITKHGGSHTRTYKAWCGMKARVAGNGPWNKKYYVDRNITVCIRWKEGFEAFLADMGKCPSGLTLERINNDKGYQPGNCRWATRSEQMANTRRSHHVIVGSEVMCLAHACKRIGIGYRTAMKRISRGLTPQQAIDYEVT